MEGDGHRPEQVFGIPVINVLWSIVAGHRFQVDDPRATRLMDLLNRCQAGLNSTLCRLFKSKIALEYFFPVWGVICYLVPGLNTRSRIITELRTMFRFVITSIVQQQESNNCVHQEEH